MIVSTNKNFIFAAYQKTGTTSIESALYPHRNRPYHKFLKIKCRYKYNHRFKHLPAELIREMVGHKRWDNSFTFSFVRNPWDRILSLYTGHEHDGPISVKQGFTEWILNGGNWLAKQQHFTDFISDKNGKSIIDYVGKYETLHDDIKVICKNIGIEEIKLPHKNKSSSRIKYREIYTEETMQIVQEWKKKDIEEYGYEF